MIELSLRLKATVLLTLGLAVSAFARRGRHDAVIAFVLASVARE